MANRGPPPPPPPPMGPMPPFQDGPRPPQQGFPQQPPMQQRFVPPPFPSTTRVSDITPRVELTEEFYRRQLTSYEVFSFRKAEPLKTGNFLENKKDQGTKKSKKGSKRPKGPKPDWQRVIISQDILDQDVILKKIRTLNNKGKSITDKKAELSPHMNVQVNNLLDEKNNFEFDTAFTWTLSQLDRQTVQNRETRRRETETLTLYLKRAPRPEVNVVVVYKNIERAKSMQGQPPPQQQQQPPPPPQPRNGPPPLQQRSSFQGPPGQQKQPPGKFPPPPIQIIHEGQKSGGNFGAKGAKGGQDDVIHVIEKGGPQRKGGKTVYSKRKSINYRSDDSGSSRSSRSSISSRSSSDTDSDAYSDSETDPSSISIGSTNRRRRDSGYGPGKGKGLKQHEKGYFMVDRPHRRSTSYVPDPPRMRARSYERTSHDPIEVAQQISEAKAEGFAAGYTSGSRFASIDRTAMPLQRTIMFPDDLSQHSSLRSLDEEVRALDDRRAEVARLERLRLQDDLRRQEDLRVRNDLRMREEANTRLREDLRRFSDVPTREELRLHTDLRRAQDVILQDELPSPRMRSPDYLRKGSVSPLSFDSMPSPRAREFEHRPRDRDIPFQYVRNPFAPRRAEPLYRD